MIYKHRLVAASVLAGAALAFGGPGTLSAQQLQQDAGAGLQNQTGQAQNTGGAQNDVGTLQNNNAQPALNQNSPGSIGVFSDPNQASPDVVVAPSANLTTDVSPEHNSSRTPAVVALLAFLAGFIGLYWLRRTSATRSASSTSSAASGVSSSSSDSTADNSTGPSAGSNSEKTPSIKPEPIKPPKKKKQKKKKKKPYRR